MKKKFRLGKLLVVIFLTILIWVWADRAKTETLPVTTGLIKIDESADPQLWITIDNKKSVNIEKIELEGASSKIDEVQRKLRERELVFEFLLSPEQLPALKEGEEISIEEISINVSELLRKSQTIRKHGLTVKTCVPENIKVQVHRLEETTLNVECIDERTGSTLKPEIIEPSQVTIPALADWPGPALVKLSDSEIREAKSKQITNKIPFIELPDGQRRYSNTAVTIKLPETEGLQPQTIQLANIGIVVSPNLFDLFGRYEIKLKNEAELATIRIKATSAAAQRYKDEPFQMYLYILEEDAKKQGEQSKPVVYNFPDESVRNNEIELNQLHADAKFELIPKTP